MEKFKAEGPGLPSLQLSKGYDILKQFSTELEQHRKSRDDLVLAEKLFDMEITDYPDLIQVRIDTGLRDQLRDLGLRFSQRMLQSSSFVFSELFYDIWKMASVGFTAQSTMRAWSKRMLLRYI